MLLHCTNYCLQYQTERFPMRVCVCVCVFGPVGSRPLVFIFPLKRRPSRFNEAAEYLWGSNHTSRPTP